MTVTHVFGAIAAEESAPFRLHALHFGVGGATGDSSTLYFTAGIKCVDSTVAGLSSTTSHEAGDT